MIPAHTYCDDYRRPQHDDKAAAGIFVLWTRAAPNGQKKGCDYGSHSNHAATPVPKAVPIKGQVDLCKRRKLDLPAVLVLKKIENNRTVRHWQSCAHSHFETFWRDGCSQIPHQRKRCCFPQSLNWRRVGRREALTLLLDAGGQNNFSMCKKQN